MKGSRITQYVPNGDRGVVSETKLGGYLLSTTHPVGRDKAKFFKDLGFDEASAEMLSQGLLSMLRSRPIVKVEEGTHGVKYVVEGSLIGPMGKAASVRSVWIIEHGDEIPKLITAYPARTSKEG